MYTKYKNILHFLVIMHQCMIATLYKKSKSLQWIWKTKKGQLYTNENVILHELANSFFSM